MDIFILFISLSSAAAGAAVAWFFLAQRIGELKTEKDELGKAFHKASQESAVLRTQNEHLTGDKSRFESLANDILDKKTEKFDRQAKEQIGHALAPFQRDLDNLKKSVDQSTMEKFSLKQQIEQIGQHADNLATALKSSPKARGNWGEIVLERVLEESGLRKGHEYSLQGSGAGLKHEETGQRLQPDVIIHLPEKKHLIIDSKLSLVSYEAYYTAPSDEERRDHLKKFLAATKKHIQDLEQKRYQDSQLAAPDFVMLFMPIEGAYMLALSEDASLHKYAWDRKIVMVSPSTLFAMLRTVSSLWRLQKQNQNADEIARQGGALYDKISRFVESLDDLGQRLNQAQGSYDEARKRLATGRGNILEQTERLKQLGANTSKQLDHESE